MNKIAHEKEFYMDWLKVLYLLMDKVRKEGLISIEGDVDNPSGKQSVFSRFPSTLEQPYLEVATDFLRLILWGNCNPKEMQRISDLVLNGYAEAGKANMHVLRLIWTTLWAAISGYAPQVAVEFGRQAIPLHCKPVYAEMHDEISQVKYHLSKEQIRKRETLDVAIDRFMASISTKTQENLSEAEIMKAEEFASICASLYKMSPLQRERLQELLSSRLWHYEDSAELAFEHLCELGASALEKILKNTDLYTLAIASKGASKKLLARIKGFLSESDCSTFDAHWDELGPTRLSVVEEAQTKILGTYLQLRNAGELTPALIHYTMDPDKEEKNRHPQQQDRQAEPHAWYPLFALSDHEIQVLSSELDSKLIADALRFVSDSGGFHCVYDGIVTPLLGNQLSIKPFSQFRFC